MLLTALAMPSRKQGWSPIKKLLITMKITALLLLVACMQVSAKGNAQTLSLDITNAPLEKVFQEIKKQTGYTFFYKASILVEASKVSVNVKNASLQQVLDICFKDQPLTYTIIEKTIVVKKKEPEVTKSPNNVATNLPPPIDVHGRIVNENSEPVLASVQVKGTNKGTTTDENGEFELKGIENNATLIVSGVSIETIEIKLNGRTDLTGLTVKSKVTIGPEVIINKGPYSTSQKLNTGSVSKITSEIIQKQLAGNPLQAIEGRMPGVNIQQRSGAPGTAIDISIRGRNSLRFDGNNPLYIIDGVPFPAASQTTPNASGLIGLSYSPLNNINPSDIESIEILKDADATSIYGSRGANGVVLITTKQGKLGDTKVDFSFTTGFGKATKTIDLLNTQQYIQMRREAFKNDNAIPQFYDYDINGTWDTTKFTDWQKVFIGNTAHYNDGQVNIYGGNKNVQFIVGSGFHKETTILPGNSRDQKISTHFGVTNISNNKKFQLKLTGFYSEGINELPQFDLTKNLILSPNAPDIYDSLGNLNWANGTWTNPFATLMQTHKTKTKNLIGNLTVAYELFKGLRLKGSAGYTNISLNDIVLNPLKSYSPSSGLTSGDAVFSTNNIRTWIVEPQINYLKNIDKISLEFLFGSTLQENLQDRTSLRASGFTSDALIENPAAASSVSLVANENIQYRYAAIYSRIGINYSDKYLINFTGRRDGSSRFGQDNRFGNFGAIGLGWLFSNEEFSKKSMRFISYGKLRSSFGLSGSDQIGDYGYLDTYTPTGSGNSYLNVVPLTPDRLINPDFSWESNRKIDVALELSFLNNRISSVVNYFYNRSSDQLLNIPLPSITGFTSVQGNRKAIVDNWGWEFQIASSNIIRKKFEWTTAFNLTVPKNKLVSFPDLSTSTFANNYIIGKSLYIQKKYHFTGVNPQTGVLQFEDIDHNGNPIPSFPNDLAGLKELGQMFFGGLQNTFRFKQFQLDIYLQFNKQTGVSYLSLFPATPGIRSNQPTLVLSRWRTPGDITTVPKYSQDFGTNYTLYSDLVSSDKNIVDASFVRLKNIYLSYQVPTQILQKARLKGASLYLQGQNLFTITNYFGLDPESQSFLPLVRTIALGIKLSL